MNVINADVYSKHRYDLATHYPFTVNVISGSENYYLICENLKLAAQYCIELIKIIPQKYLYVPKMHVNLTLMRTDNDYHLIKDFTPINLNWTIGPISVSMTFKGLRISDGIRLQSYITQLRRIDF